MKQIKAKITRNDVVAEDFCKMRIESAYLAKNIKPGQFVEVLCSNGPDPLLRRPLGTHRILKNGIEMLYEVVGKGTELLSKKRHGDTLDIIGPLGNGFDIRSTKYDIRNTILIAGGIGIAPLVALAEELRKHKNKVHVIIGAKTKAHILCYGELKAMGCSTAVVTEDGSKGHKGLVTDLLQNTIYDILNTQYEIYACGPNGMLKAIWDIASRRKISCQFSFESRMACGVGVCLGCPIKIRTSYIVDRTSKVKNHTNYEYKMVCKDGPVFDAEMVAW